MQSKPRILVTGTSSGIGHAIAVFLLEHGYCVCGADIATATIIHPAFQSFPVDLTDGLAIDRMLSQLGSVSGFVHAAGVLRVNGIGQLVDADLDLMWRIHVSALAHIANVLMPYMVEQKNGRVVLIGSRVAQGLAGRSHYAASKAALIAMAKSWASEVVAQGVTVNVVSPAATQTAMLDDPARQTASPKVPPLGRLIQPQEIASLVGYLLSPMAAAITGQDIQICGGSSLPR